MTQKASFYFFIFLLVGLAAGVGGATGAAAIPENPMAHAGWEEFSVGSASGGGISQSLNPAYGPSITYDAEGYPVISWTEHVEEDWETYVRRWNGQSWIEVGTGSASGNGISDDSGESESGRVAVTPDGSIIVVWTNYYDQSYAGSDIFVRRWDGIAWREMGNGSAIGGGMSQTDSHGSMWPTIAIDSDGMPIIAWSEQINNTWEIYVRRWDGTAWREMGTHSGSSGGVSNNAGYSIYPSLEIAPDGTPFITWADNSGGDHDIYIRRWDGAAWVEMNNGSAYGGGVSDDYTQSTHSSLAFFPNGKPIVAWVNYSGSAEEQWEIFARRWDGTAWVEMNGSASDGGISRNSGISVEPTLAMLPDGSPLVVWMDDTSGGYEIYALRWDGSAWVEAGVGAASLGGISDRNGSSENPALAIGPDGRAIVAWHYWDGNLSEIYVRRSPQLNSYRFHVPALFNLICLSGLNEVEPNNSQTSANGALCNGQTNQGLPTDNFDVFYFDVGQPGDVAVTVDNHTGGGVQVALHHQAITANPLDLDFTAGDGFRVAAANAAPGRYYVVIYAATPGPATPYTLRAQWE